ncbi:type II toxin-antitoxin system HicB family antitoxin [Halobacterium sp. KA-6]|uniref:type II toxin-antitoxin system HicB family antitoxin n=1 Tax=Halobacterium sp. KA-6 TaxID=2896368 RepID=UPI001E631656|nr:hypothetical protein [Halobacterium sp. KA-6]MCD2204918.1 hypothetical protein [Halobacterium sp. KA-6]
MTENITIDREDDWYVITDEETGVTTQGESKNEALLMLADALAAYEASNEDLLAMATDIFVPDPDMPTIEDQDGDDWSSDPPSESRIKKNRELVVHLAKSHKRTNFSDNHVINQINSMVQGSSCGTNDDDSSEDRGNLQETIIRYDPENVTSGESRERLRQIDAAETEAEKQSIPERRVFSVGTDEDYERISEAAWGVANAFVGRSLHAGHELVACPECGYEGHVDQAVFPGGTDHYTNPEHEDE